MANPSVLNTTCELCHPHNCFARCRLKLPRLAQAVPHDFPDDCHRRLKYTTLSVLLKCIDHKWITTSRMEKSLNSSRNFKLPPIQGAVPAANILRQPTAKNTHLTWPHAERERSSATLPRHRSTVKPRQVIHVTNDPFPVRYRSPHINRNSTNTSTQHHAISDPIENERNRELTLELAPLVHQFPQTYTVLPPIQKLQRPLVNETSVATRDKGSRGGEPKNQTDSKSASYDGLKPNDKQRLDNAQKPEDSKDSKTDNDSDLVAAQNASKKRRRPDAENHDQETGERKPSATLLLFLKGKRKGRRVGVCLENEPALINVTEQLKEIFLRRNMEEMYLI